MKLLKLEFWKTRRRYLFLTVLAITAVEVVWLWYGSDSDAMKKDGWMGYLYQMPMLNSIFLSLLCTVIASRLADVEHKGLMLKQLFCLAPRGKLFDAKLLYGLGLVMISLIIQFAAIYLCGTFYGFSGEYPAASYALYWLFTLLPTVNIYLFQHALSLLFRNQAVPFIAGVSGTFLGLFSLFFPQLPWLRQILPWGHYGALQFVGNNWSRESRVNDFYYFPVDWPTVAIVVGFALLLYLAGRWLFCRKEI